MIPLFDWGVLEKRADTELQEKMEAKQMEHIDRTLLRLREVFAYVGRHRNDPINHIHHYLTWRHFRQENRPIPVLFFSFEDLVSPDREVREEAQRELEAFIGRDRRRERSLQNRKIASSNGNGNGNGNGGDGSWVQPHNRYRNDLLDVVLDKEEMSPQHYREVEAGLAFLKKAAEQLKETAGKVIMA